MNWLAGTCPRERPCCNLNKGYHKCTKEWKCSGWGFSKCSQGNDVPLHCHYNTNLIRALEHVSFGRCNCNTICVSLEPPRSRCHDEIRCARDLLRETSLRENREGPEEAERAKRHWGSCTFHEGGSGEGKAHTAGQVSERLVKASGRESLNHSRPSEKSELSHKWACFLPLVPLITSQEKPGEAQHGPSTRMQRHQLGLSVKYMAAPCSRRPEQSTLVATTVLTLKTAVGTCSGSSEWLSKPLQWLIPANAHRWIQPPRLLN